MSSLQLKPNYQVNYQALHVLNQVCKTTENAFSGWDSGSGIELHSQNSDVNHNWTDEQIEALVWCLFGS